MKSSVFCILPLAIVNVGIQLSVAAFVVKRQRQQQQQHGGSPIVRRRGGQCGGGCGGFWLNEKGSLSPRRHLFAKSDHHQNIENDNEQIVPNMDDNDVITTSKPRTKSLKLARTWATAAFSMSLFLSASLGSTLPSHAAGYNSFTDEQKTVAEAWRLVDYSFLDRTFNGQDWFQLRQNYVVKKKYKSMDEAHSAIDQMVATLGDKYTRYLSPAKYQSIIDSATGTLAGVGVEISANKEGRIFASDTEANSPARNAGIQVGDIFLEVDGQKFDEKSTPDDVALKLRGPKGSRVGVVMEREGKVQDFILTREPITITSVRPYVLSNNVPGVGKVGVIRIKSFSSTTSDTVASVVGDLKKQGCKAFVFDIRGNPGGLLPGGVNTASLFLEENKPVVFVVSKTGVIDSQAALGNGIDTESPIVILVDSSTASAAEVFTAALKENGRALVVGEQTFGKGIVQTIRGLSGNNGGLAITVARYETPKHNNINKQGIPVDLASPVTCPKDDATDCLKGIPFKKTGDA